MGRVARVQDLDRDLAFERDLSGSIHPPDGPPPDHRSENVFAVENPPRKRVLVHFVWRSNSPASTDVNASLMSPPGCRRLGEPTGSIDRVGDPERASNNVLADRRVAVRAVRVASWHGGALQGP